MSNIELYKGDCLEVMDELTDRSIEVDCVLADLPYGTTGCKWDSVIPFDEMWKRLNKLIKENGAMVFTASQPFTTNLIYSNLELFKYCWVWEKSRGSNFVHANYQPLKCHEDIVVFSKGTSAQGGKNPMVYNPQHFDGKPYNKGNTQKQNRHLIGGNTTYPHLNETGKRKPRSVLYFNSDSDKEDRGLHPTQKPVALMEYLIKTYTNKGETVLDFTMGSGTTGVACMNTERNFIGIELDDNYFKIAEDRINKAKETPIQGELF